MSIIGSENLKKNKRLILVLVLFLFLILFISIFFSLVFQDLFILIGRASQITHGLLIIDPDPPTYSNVQQNESEPLIGNPVELSANLSDNIELGYAWLATNETGEWENKTGIYNSPIDLNGTSDWSNFTWLNSSFSGVIGWKIYVNDTSGNENSTEINSFEVLTAPPTPPPSPPGPPAPAPKINFTVEPDLIKILLKQGETQTRTINISNTGDTKLNISIVLQDLKKFILLSEEEFELEPSQSKIVTLDFTASEDEVPDVYTGRMLITGDGIEKIVRIIIEVKAKKPLFDIKVVIPENFKIVEIGKNVKANITILNLGEIRPADIILEYSIKDMDGNIINSKHETLAVEIKTSISRELKVPEDTKIGDCIFYVKLTYDKYIATSSDLFEVVLPKEVPVVRVIYILIIVIGIAVMTILIISQKFLKKKMIKRQRKLKKNKKII